MSQLEVSKAEAAEERSEQTRSFVRTVKAAARRKYTSEEKIRIVLEGFRREVTVNDLCRREGIKLLATSKSGTHWEPRDQGLDGGLMSSLRALL